MNKTIVNWQVTSVEIMIFLLQSFFATRTSAMFFNMHFFSFCME